MKKQVKWGIGIGAAALAAGLLIWAAIPKTKVVAPTCEAKGYTAYTRFGTTRFENLVDPLGHSYSDWEDVNESLRRQVCTRCGAEQTESVLSQTQIAQMHLTGDLSEISKTTQAPVDVTFSGQGVAFEGYGLVKYQGHSSLLYDKRNYTLKLFSDKRCNDKAKLTFSHWQPEHKYILKACYHDPSRSRNLIGADVWAQMVSTRAQLPARLQETSNYGAVDGFPVAVYLNDQFLGLYVLTLHKDDDLFAMEDGRKDGIVIVNETNTQAAFFQDEIDWSGGDWEVEYSGIEDDQWIKEKTDEFVKFVRHSTDENFRQKLSQYADVDSLIDYLIAMYALGLADNCAKDMVLATYDDGVFFASMFDMGASFGAKRNTEEFAQAGDDLPYVNDGVWFSGTKSLLWDRLIANFYPQICDRYQALRKEVLSESNLVNVAQEKLSAIPQELNREDLALYPNQPRQDADHLQQIQTYIRERFSQLDTIFTETKE